MKEIHERFIRDNSDKMSIQEIAGRLNLKPRQVRKFLSRQRDNRKVLEKGHAVREGAADIRRWNLRAVLLIILVGGVVYFNSLNGSFIWDDVMLVQKNGYIKGWGHVGDIFSGHISTKHVDFKFYRPLQMLSYAADNALWGENPFGYHLLNIILHLLVAFSVFRFSSIVLRSGKAGLFTALFFVVHPIHTGAVSYISGRSDLLAALFIFLTLILYIRSFETKNRTIWWYSLVFCVCAFLARETAIILAGLLLLYHYSFGKGIEKGRFIPFVVLMLIYVIARFTFLSHVMGGESDTIPFLGRVAGSFAAFFTYLKLLFFPYPLHMEYGIRSFSILDIRVMAGLILLILSVAYVLGQRRKTDRIVFFCLAWFLAALVPVSNLYPINAYMAEHWMYVPSVGLFMIAGRFLADMSDKEKYAKPVLVFIISLIAVYGVVTVKQNGYWTSPEVFYEKTLKYASDSSRMYNNLGNVYMNEGRSVDKAVSYFKKAIELKPTFANAHYNLGNVYADKGKTEDAIVYYKKAIELAPAYINTYINLADMYAKSGQAGAAIDILNRAMSVSQAYPDVYNRLAALYMDKGNPGESVNILKKGIMKIPRNASLQYNLGNAYTRSGDVENAVRSYNQAVRLDPGYTDAYYNLGSVYNKAGKVEESIGAYKRVLSIYPRDAGAHNNLMLLYYRTGEYEKAAYHCDKAVGLGVNVQSDVLKKLDGYRKR